LLSFVQIFFFFFPLSELNPPVSLYKGDNPPPPTASSNSLLILFPRSSFHLLAVSLLAPPPRPPGESGLTQLYFPLYLRWLARRILFTHPAHIRVQLHTPSIQYCPSSFLRLFQNNFRPMNELSCNLFSCQQTSFQWLAKKGVLIICSANSQSAN
jgi:hypothetical protein